MKKPIYLLALIQYLFFNYAGAQNLLQNNYPNVNGQIYAMVSDTIRKTLFIGGAFTQVGDSVRNHLACIDSLGRVTSWNPNVNGNVYALNLFGSSNILIVGGSFDTAYGMHRRNLASFYTIVNTNILTTWNPEANNQVNSLAASSQGNIIYVGGGFDTIGATYRNGLAALDPYFNYVTPWNPIVSKNGIITTNSLTAKNNELYLRGTFDTINGIKRKGIVSIDETTGGINTWNPNLNAGVHSLQILDSIVYITGLFNNVGGQVRNGIAAINRFTGIATNWNPNLNNSLTPQMYSLAYYSGKFYTGCASPNWARSIIVSIDKNTGVIDTLSSVTGAGIWVFSVLPTRDRLYVGGGFSNANGLPKSNLAVFSGNYILPIKWLSLNGNLNGNKVNLIWKVANEINNSHFEIERSNDGYNFYSVGTIKGVGSSQNINEYEYVDYLDDLSNNSNLYYRIRQFDYNGENDLSKMLVVNSSNQDITRGLLVLPNPANQKIIIKGLNTETAEIIDLYSNIKRTIIGDGEHSIADLPKGMYFIRSKDIVTKLIIE